MVQSHLRLSANQCIVVALIAFGLAIPLPSTVQGRDKAEAYAFLSFLQSVTSQRTATMCERGIPEYRQRFDTLYTRWSEKHRDAIARGEGVFRNAIRTKDRTGTDNAKLEEIENAIAELAQGSGDTSPIKMNAALLAVCKNNLADLEGGLGS